MLTNELEINIKFIKSAIWITIRCTLSESVKKQWNRGKLAIKYYLMTFSEFFLLPFVSLCVAWRISFPFEYFVRVPIVNFIALMKEERKIHNFIVCALGSYVTLAFKVFKLAWKRIFIMTLSRKKYCLTLGWLENFSN